MSFSAAATRIAAPIDAGNDCDALALVRVPCRAAHHITGQAVARADALGVKLDAVPLADLQAIDARIDDRVYGVLSVDASVASRTSFGGTAPSRVRAAIAAAREGKRS